MERNSGSQDRIQELDGSDRYRHCQSTSTWRKESRLHGQCAVTRMRLPPLLRTLLSRTFVL